AAAQGTRGAAVGIAEINVATQVIRFAGVGNIAGVVWTAAGSRGMASHNGIVGHDMRRRQMFTYPWSPGAVVVLHSDGLQSRWRLDAYPGLARRHPSLIAGVLYRDLQRERDGGTPAAPARPPREPSLSAGVLYRDFKRERDDVTVLAVAAAPPSGAKTRPREE